MAHDGFRALHVPGDPLLIPNPWDVGSARILAAMGFQALATTSAGMAYGLGKAEGTANREETLDHCRVLSAATPLPVSAGLEKGFADDPDGVAETIRLAVGTGLAGASIEDFTGDAANPAYDFDLSVARVKAAVDAARAADPNFVLTARCDVLQYEDWPLSDVIDRLNAYADAGADVVYAPGLYDLDSIRTVCRAARAPVNVVMGMPGRTFTIPELADAGVARISVGSVLARLAYTSLIRAGEEMRDRGAFSFTGDALGFQVLDEMMTRTP